MDNPKRPEILHLPTRSDFDPDEIASYREELGSFCPPNATDREVDVLGDLHQLAEDNLFLEAENRKPEDRLWARVCKGINLIEELIRERQKKPGA